jgi:hypothetical protein
MPEFYLKICVMCKFKQLLAFIETEDLPPSPQQPTATCICFIDFGLFK